MSKKEKLLARLKKNPAPKDFAWEELVTLMRQYYFKESCQGGSHYTFEHVSGFRFCMSKTHPSGLLKRYQIQEALSAINRVDQKGEDND